MTVVARSRQDVSNPTADLQICAKMACSNTEVDNQERYVEMDCMFVCWLLALHPSKMLVYLGDGSVLTSVHNATLR